MSKPCYFFCVLILLSTISVAQSSAFKTSATKKGAVQKNEIVLITNPVFNVIALDSTGTEFYEYFISGMDEKLIRQGWYMNNVPVKFLAPGNYFLTVNKKDQVIKRQFLKLEAHDNISMREIYQ